MNSTIQAIQSNPSLEGMVEMSGDILYSLATGTQLIMRVVTPWSNRFTTESPPLRPLLVFIQGSAWSTPNLNYQLPQLAFYAQRGYVVATISHRSIADGHSAPAYLKDIKTAVRFLRAHAEDYRIDKDRVIAFGTSSGGNAALLLGLTGDAPRYKTTEYADESDRVNAVIDCFGPTDLIGLRKMFALANPNAENMPEYQMLAAFCGGNPSENDTILYEMSPLHILQEGVCYPPIFLLHGDRDTLVPYAQSHELYEKLLSYQQAAQLLRVENAGHEEDFWSFEVHKQILAFLETQ